MAVATIAYIGLQAFRASKCAMTAAGAYVYAVCGDDQAVESHRRFFEWTFSHAIDWNDGNNSPSVSGSSVATNGEWAQFSSVIYAAGGTSISFNTTFSSVTGSPAYTASFNVEQLQ